MDIQIAIELASLVIAAIGLGIYIERIPIGHKKNSRPPTKGCG